MVHASPSTKLSPRTGWPQVVDKSRYAAGDNSLEREIQVLCKVCAYALEATPDGGCQAELEEALAECSIRQHFGSGGLLGECHQRQLGTHYPCPLVALAIYCWQLVSFWQQHSS